jgi:hypothetical protein
VQVQWLIESDVFDKPLAEEVRRQGFPIQSCNYVPYKSGESYLKSFESHSCVIFRGSLEFSDQVRKEATWVPGVYYNKEKYFCSRYYPFLRNLLLAEEYIMLPYGDLKAKEDFIFDCVGADNAVFIRPDSGHKRFAGKLLYRENFQKDIDYLGFYEVQPWEICVLSRPRNILNEWRFVVVGCKVISGGLYRSDGKKDERSSYTQKALDLAQLSARMYQPDRVFIVDICNTVADNYYVLEIGCFSCAGLYQQSNLPLIVSSVSRIALEEWSEINLGS